MYSHEIKISHTVCQFGSYATQLENFDKDASISFRFSVFRGIHVPMLISIPRQHSLLLVYLSIKYLSYLYLSIKLLVLEYLSYLHFFNNYYLYLDHYLST